MRWPRVQGGGARWRSRRRRWWRRRHDGDGWSRRIPSDRSTQEELDDVVNDLIFAVQEVADRRLGIATGSTNEASRPLRKPKALPPLETRGGGGHRRCRRRLRGVAREGCHPWWLQGSPPPTSASSPVWPTSANCSARSPTRSKRPPRDLAAAEEAARALHRTLSTEVVSVLGVTLMFGDTDGDS